MGARDRSSQPSSRRAAPRRLFTLEEANRTLPLVRRIVSDIVFGHAQLGELLAARQEAIAAGCASSEADAVVRSAVSRLNELIDELQGIGCDLKDWETGIVDFPTERGGETACLCWRLGEERIGHWHEWHAGLAGRRGLEDGFAAPPRDAARPAATGRRR